jgi:ATP adenylyltransferase
VEYFFNFDKLTYVQNAKPDGCILCLIRDKSPDVVDLSVCSDDSFIASVNLYPYNPGHLIVFPVRHIEDIRQYTPEESAALHGMTCRLLSVLDSVYNPAGYNIGYNMGLNAGASIRHLHLHIIPRFPREIGIAELVGGKRVLVEGPYETADKLRKVLAAEKPQ